MLKDILSVLPVTRYEVTIACTKEIQFNSYAGSAIRGAFGHALKKIACLTSSYNGNHKGECQCEVGCIYKQLFDQDAPDNQASIPVPMVFECHDLPSKLKTHEEARFCIVLIGQFAHEQLAIIKLAMQQALMMGIGNKDPERGSATLVSFLPKNKPNENWEYPYIRNDIQKCLFKVTLSFKTPTRLQKHGRILTKDALMAEDVVIAMLRRPKLLLASYASKPDTQSCFTDMFSQKNNTVCLTKNNLKTQHWKRYSNRQKVQQKMTGFLGEITLTNVPASLTYILYLNHWLHIGKNTVFGLGYYDLDIHDLLSDPAT